MAVHGEFDLTATTPDGPRASHMSVDVDGGNITGTITADGQTAPITDGHITEDLVFKAKCDDTACSTVTGTVAVPGVGEFPLKGKRA